MVERHFGPIPANDNLPPPPDMSIPPLIGQALREEVADRVPLPRVYVAYRMPDLRQRCLRRPVGRRRRPGRRPCVAPVQPPGPRAAARPGRRASSPSRSWAARRCSRCGPPPSPGSAPISSRPRLLAEIDQLAHRGADRSRARARRQPACRRSGVQPGAHRRARRSAVDVRLPVRRAGAHQHRGEPLPGASTPSAYGAPWPRPLRPDNRVVLTYVPAEAPAVEAA